MTEIPFKVESGPPMIVRYEVAGRHFVSRLALVVMAAKATGKTNADGSPNVNIDWQVVATNEEVTEEAPRVRLVTETS